MESFATRERSSMRTVPIVTLSLALALAGPLAGAAGAADVEPVRYAGRTIEEWVARLGSDDRDRVLGALLALSKLSLAWRADRDGWSELAAALVEEVDGTPGEAGLAKMLGAEHALLDLSESADPKLEAAAMLVLSNLGAVDEAIRAQLLVKAGSPDSFVRSLAITGLALGPAEETTLAALRSALGDLHAKVRSTAAIGLARHGTASIAALPDLRSLARSDPEVAVRRRTIAAIAAIAPGSPDTRGFLRAIAEDPDQPVRVRERAVEALRGP